MDSGISDGLALHQQGNRLTISLNRPDNHNAMDPAMINALIAAFAQLEERDDVRVVVLSGRGRSFCAGADLSYMRAAADYSFDENVADSQAIFDLMDTISRCSKPVIGRVNGAAIGGGLGMVACCDIVVSVARAKFGFSETRLGLVPAVISPFVLAKIGAGWGRELFLTGERFDAPFAQQIGLVHHLVPDEDALDEKVEERVSQLLLAAPGAQAAVKALIGRVAGQPVETTRQYTAELIARRRDSREGREGMTAFLEKRRPNWQEHE